MTEMSVTCFGDISTSIESMTNDMLNSSSFAIANSMIQSDIETIHLSQTTDEVNSEVNGFHHSLEYTIERVVGVEDCSDESFNELVPNVPIGSNSLVDNSGVSVSTRLRRRKASQPQRLVYCDLDFNLNEDRTVNSSGQLSGTVVSNEKCKQSSVDEGIGLSSLEDSTQESNDDEDREETTEDKNQIKQKKSSKGFECEICGSLWNSQTRLKSHYRTHGAAKHLKCEICGKLFGWEYSWKTHMLAHSDDNPNKCSQCGIKLFNKTALKNHMKRIHDSPDRPFECSVCSKCFISKSELNQHIQIHNESKNFMCEQCGKTFRSKSYLERHYKTHTGVKPFKCEFCGKMLSDKTGFTAHVRSHKGERPYQCDICGKKYTIKRHLTSHVIIHSDLRPFECDQCGKTFRSRTNFRMHKDSHLGVKRWQCKFCQRTFLSQGNMAKHVRRHIGDRKHKCELCGKAFIEKQELKNHSKMHSNGDVSKWKKDQVDKESQLHMLPQTTPSDLSTLSSTNSTTSDSNTETNINEIKDPIHANITNVSETDLNFDLTSMANHSSLISLASPLAITLPSLGQNLCLPMSASIYSLPSLSSGQTYQNLENSNPSAIDSNASQLTFCDYQRVDSINSRNYLMTNASNSCRSPSDELNSFFNNNQTSIVSATTSNSPFLADNTSYQAIHCSLCSEVFTTSNSLRQHLIDFHRVEAEKAVTMMY